MLLRPESSMSDWQEPVVPSELTQAARLSASELILACGTEPVRSGVTVRARPEAVSINVVTRVAALARMVWLALPICVSDVAMPARADAATTVVISLTETN